MKRINHVSEVTYFLLSSAKNLILEILENSHIINIQVINSISLCISTLVVILKVMFLPYLSNLVNSLLLFLTSDNELINPYSRSRSGNGIHLSITYLQFLIVRDLDEVVVSLLLFVVSYLNILLSPQEISSLIIRQDNIEKKQYAQRNSDTFWYSYTLSPER